MNTVDRRDFIGNAMAYAALGGCVSSGRQDGFAAPRLEFGDDGEFRFLQITDLHLKPADGQLHPRVEKTLRAAFAKFRPSLLVLTGDNVSGQDGDVNARGSFETSVDPLIGLFREHRIPFCVTFGNHDSERKGAFFGHDHMNTFCGIDENGLCLGMTKCCSLWTYHDDNPGVRAFTVRPDGTYSTEMFTELANNC